MKQYINSTFFLFSILFLLILKGFLTKDLNLAESLSFFSVILAISYQKYLDFKKKEDIHADYKRRLNNIESKLGAFDVSKRISNR